MQSPRNFQQRNSGTLSDRAPAPASAGAAPLTPIQRAFLARRRDAALRPEKIRLSLAEAALVGILCMVQLGVGFYTEPWLEIVEGPLGKLAERLEKAAQ